MDGELTELIIDPNTQKPIPDYFKSANWAFSPKLKKFVNRLPGLTTDNANELGQYLPVAIPDKTRYPGSDYYEIAVVEYTEKMHSDLPETTLRGYVQLSTSSVPGERYVLNYNNVPIIKGDGSPAYSVDKPHYLGPVIFAQKNVPVRIKFFNLLPIGVKGDLFIPVDTTVMGAGMGPLGMNADPMNYTQNRANIHLHGSNTVWISDGTPHQWITPAGENTPYPQGVSVVNVPDMDDVDDPRDGISTLYYTNAQSSRMMFYHDHSYGITRLNVYAGEAAPFILTDEVEQDLIFGTNDTGVNPDHVRYLPEESIPLVIQDKTFVDANTIKETDPTWMWGTGGNIPNTGDLWYPHVYSPAQNPWDPSGYNAYGRWMYGPWFWPPTQNITHGPVPNPYYDQTNPTERPPMMPDMPFPSMPGEAFMDTPIVNGTAYPYMVVAPKAYRFRILNAADDRFFNLQMYVADDNGYISPDTGYPTEVKMISACGTAGIPADWPSGIPDPLMKGPDWIQIGNESGFLPRPVIIPNQPITWNLNATNFNFGNVADHALLLGTAERADVIVDFSGFAGKTIILYNDAPAAFPASDPRYDYYTGNPDQTSEGGAPSTQPGYGPNTRTVMQFRILDSVPAPTYNFDALTAVFAKSGLKRGVFETSQDTIIIPQAVYNTAYNTSDLPSDPSAAYIQQYENEKTFTPIDNEGKLLQPVTLRIEPKAIQDEMGEVYDMQFGRMSGMLGLELPLTTSAANRFTVYGYASPPVEIIKGMDDINQTPIGSANDGTQIWKITHNGVDTHTIHVHLFSAQLINRVAWDGALLPPDPNELGWKETFRVNPLEHLIFAFRPVIKHASAIIPFEIPNSVRLIDPTMPEGVELTPPPPVGWFDPLGNPAGAITNRYINYGWEYVFHCHILAHEEMDMMHSMCIAATPKAPTNLTGNLYRNGTNSRVVLRWTNNSSALTGIVVQIAPQASGPWSDLILLPADSDSYAYYTTNRNTFYYRIYAQNIVGDHQSVGFPTISNNSAFSNTVRVGNVVPLPPRAPYDLRIRLINNAQVELSWLDDSNNEAFFIVERSDNGGRFAVIGELPANNMSERIYFTDNSAAPGNRYTYRVAAVNNVGMSAYSNRVGIRIPLI